MRTKFVLKRLEDEYTPNQLDPVVEDEQSQPVSPMDAIAPQDDVPSPAADSTSANDFEDLPVVTEQSMRLSVFETIVEEEIAEIVNENDGVVNEDTIREELEPVIEKAAMLNKIPRRYADNLLNRLLAKRRMVRNPYTVLLEKVAHKLTDDLSTIEEDEVRVDEVVENTTPAESDSIASEVVSDSPDNIEVDENVPVDAAVSMRYLGASALNHRKATALAIKRVGSPVLRKVVKDMRNCLPRRVSRKYFS